MKFFMICLLACSFIRAEEEVPWIKTELVTIAVYEPLEGYAVQNGEGFSSLSASVTGLSQPIPYHGPARLALMASMPEFVDPETPEPPPAAVANLPADADRVMLVCFKQENKALKLMALDVSNQQVSAGDYVFLNFSKGSVGVMLGEEVFPMEPGQVRVIQKQEWQEDNADLTIRVGIRQGTQSRLIFSSIWGHHPDRRNYVFLFAGEHASMPIVMRKVYDRPASLTPEK